MVDAGGCADEPVLGLRDHERPALAHDPFRLAQDHLDLARVALVARELDGLRRGLEAVDSDHAPLGLRDRLLRKDENVAILEPLALDDERGQVVALPDLRQAMHGDERDHLSTPVMRMPACAL